MPNRGHLRWPRRNEVVPGPAEWTWKGFTVERSIQYFRYLQSQLPLQMGVLAAFGSIGPKINGWKIVILG